GEISIHGFVKPVGGVFAKVTAARDAGAELALIPKENDEEMLQIIKGIKVIAVTHLSEVFDVAFETGKSQEFPSIVIGKSQPGS
ncbi:S16 family serine protease, partial [Staphylococcus sp. SIMBA_130]